MKQTEKLLIVAIVVMAITVVVGFLPIHGEEAIYDTALRLHVVANSDSYDDQELKMAVRDAVLDVVNPAMENCKSQEAAMEKIQELRGEIIRAANEVIRENGREYDLKIELGREKYPTKDYGSFVFPRGEYLSLRILIGEGKGENFWCCLYPPICMSAASEVSKEYADDAFIEAGLTGEQYRIITESDSIKYRVRFKILEIIEGIVD